jgi:hypothetical protein
VKTGMEYGISLVNFGDCKPGDVLEAFTSEKAAQVVT